MEVGNAAGKRHLSGVGSFSLAVVSQWEVKSLAEFEEMMTKTMANKELEEVMKGYHELVDHGRREIYTIET